MSDEKPVITHVYHWQNGMTMVFDQFGQQMPEYQGVTTPELRAKIARDMPSHASVTSKAHWTGV